MRMPRFDMRDRPASRTCRGEARGSRTALALLLLGTVATPLAAQQRVEVTTRRTSRSTPTDTAEGQQLRRLQSRADSLSRLYNDNDELSLEERRRIGEELDRTVDELTRTSMRVMASDETIRMHFAPMASEHAAADMARALMQRTPRALIPPRGWLGIVVTGAAREPWIRNGELIVRYVTHPEIVSVEPSSPAERAGLVPSDTLIAYDGLDVRERDISLTRLLKPNARVMVRVRRDGRTRDVPVTIADAPSRIQIRRDDMGQVTVMRMEGTLADAPFFPLAPAAPVAAASRLRRSYPRSPTPPVEPAVPSIAAVPSVPTMPPMFPLGFPVNGVAGAQLSSVTEGLGRTVGVKHGVLVLAAPPGSPAAESGLADGDVIVNAGGRELHSVTQLRDLVGAAVDRGERSVALECMRDKQMRTVVLRW
jgi:C-terminal processing protease CtpA/Prc